MRSGRGSARKAIVRRLIELAEEQRWTVTMTEGGHYKFLPPKGLDGPPIHVGGKTRGGGRSERNAKALLRRYGLKGV